MLLLTFLLQPFIKSVLRVWWKKVLHVKWWLNTLWLKCSYYFCFPINKDDIAKQKILKTHFRHRRGKKWLKSIMNYFFSFHVHLCQSLTLMQSGQTEQTNHQHLQQSHSRDRKNADLSRTQKLKKSLTQSFSKFGKNKYPNISAKLVSCKYFVLGFSP